MNWGLAVVTTVSAAVLAAPPANAAEVVVPCDAAALVGAVEAANASAAPDVLSLTPDCVYTLTTPADVTYGSGLPEIDGQLTIHGNDATIARAQDAPRFRIIANWGDLTLDRITITGGHARDGVGTDSFGDGNSGGSGGGIQNWGPLTITDSVITGNTAGAGAPGADATATTRAGRGGLGGFGGGISSYGAFGVVPMTIVDSLVTGNSSGAGARGGDGLGQTAGGDGGSSGFGGGVSMTSRTELRVTGTTITGNTTPDGPDGGAGGLDGGGGGDGGDAGVAAGIFVSANPGDPLNPVIASTTITGNRTGNGGNAGAAGPGGYAGWAGSAGSGGGLGVFYDTLTVDGGSITGNTVGKPGAGAFPYLAPGGGIYTLSATVALTNGASVTGNHPDNCYEVADVPGCVNDGPAIPRFRGQQAEDLATARAAR